MRGLVRALLPIAILPQIASSPACAAEIATPLTVAFSERFDGEVRFSVQTVLSTDGSTEERFLPGEHVAIQLSLVNEGKSELKLRRGMSFRSSKPGEWHGIVSIRPAAENKLPMAPTAREQWGSDSFEVDFPSYSQSIAAGGRLTSNTMLGKFDDLGEHCFNADYYLRDSSLVGKPTTTLEKTASTTFCLEVVPFAELGIMVTPERAVSIAGQAFAEAGYGEAASINRVFRDAAGDWHTGYDSAPNGGGWHVSIVIDGQTGAVKRLEKGFHTK